STECHDEHHLRQVAENHGPLHDLIVSSDLRILYEEGHDFLSALTAIASFIVKNEDKAQLIKETVIEINQRNFTACIYLTYWDRCAELRGEVRAHDSVAIGYNQVGDVEAPHPVITDRFSFVATLALTAIMVAVAPLRESSHPASETRQ
ncbi:MAG: hypothetical protein AAF968_25655, partial [Pseudomonadota bacterium]